MQITMDLQDQLNLIAANIQLCIQFHVALKSQNLHYNVVVSITNNNVSGGARQIHTMKIDFPLILNYN